MSTIYEKVIYVFEALGLDKVTAGTQAAGTAAQRAGPAFGALQRAISAVAGALAVKQLQKYSDSYLGMAGRLRIVTDGVDDFNSSQMRLQQIANETRSSIEGTTSLFTRLALQKEQLGITSDELIEVVGKVNKAIIASGASATEAAGGLVQFTQGLSSGRLQGEELRSVVENLPFLSSVLADGLRDIGILSESSIANLRRLGEAGELTTERLMAAIASQSSRIDEAFAQMPITIGQAFTILTNNMTNFVGKLGETSGVASMLANAILWVGNNIEMLANVVMVAVAAWGAYQALELVRSFQAMLTVVKLTAAPMTAIVVLGAAMIAWATTFGAEMTLTADGTMTFKDVVLGLGNAIASVVNPALEFLAENQRLAAWTVGIATVAYFGFNVVLVTVRAGIMAASAAMAIFNLVMNANPLVRLATLILLAGGALVGLAANFIGTANAAEETGDALDGTSKSMKTVATETTALDALLARMSGTFGNVKATAQTTNEALSKGARDTRTEYDKLTDAIFRANRGLDEKTGKINQTTQSQLRSNQASRDGTADNERLGQSFLEVGRAGVGAFDDITTAAYQAKIAIAAVTSELEANMRAVQSARTASSIGQNGSLAGLTAEQRQERYRATEASNPRRLTGGTTTSSSSGDYGGYLSAPRFQHGGSFTVEGDGNGPDKNLVQFKATKGENVTVQTPQQQRNEAEGSREPRTVIIEKIELVVVGVQDANDFRRTERQMMSQLSGAISKAVR
jgi:tape measure domain-containing protein